MISLCCGLNFSPNVENGPSTTLHASFSGLITVFINCKPSLPNSFLIIGIFSSSFSSYVLVWSVFVTSILKLNNSTYLSRAFQLKNSCINAGLLCLCLCACLRKAVFLPGMGPASTFLIAITAAVSTWIATFVTTD